MPNKSKAPFLPHIHTFRAFAILNIIWIHLWLIPIQIQSNPMLVETTKFIDKLREVIFHDSTIFFIFISGFLFQHINAPACSNNYMQNSFKIFRYFKGKILYVLLPYLILSSLIFAKLVPFNTPHFTYQSSVGISENLSNFVFFLSNGLGQVQYWYIPFILLLFLTAPALLKIPAKYFPYLTAITSLFPLFGTRSEVYITPWQYLFFAPIFILGMYGSLHYNKFIQRIGTIRIILLIMSTLSTLILWDISGKSIPLFASEISVIKSPFTLTESLFYIQKISLCLLVFWVLGQKQLPFKITTILNLFATYSFALFFTHSLFADVDLRILYYKPLTNFAPEFLLLWSLLYITIVPIVNLVLVMSIKRILKKHSRYLLGS